ncbi:MAG: flavodoxin [Gammaproteobacteria bacterium]|nr:flavodoxin [Gammaproteobacteria bacterium]
MRCWAIRRTGNDRASALKHLLIVYHSKTGNTQLLTDAVVRGAMNCEVTAVEVRALRALEAGPEDLLWADALLLGTPENFGYLSGAVKDFLDRTFYEVEGKLAPLPYAMFVSAGNDGTGAVRAMERIANGYPFVAVQDPLIVRGAPQQKDLVQCEELGLALALGTQMGIF